MRVLIVSDTHGSHRNLDAVLGRGGKIDALIHMGDVENGEHYIEAVADCETYMVAGNNDFFSFLPKEREFTLGKYNIFITHGHNYYVSMGTARLKEEARLRKADIVMYGHTHKPDLEFDEDIIVINPGSLSYPRQEGRRATYVMIEIDKNGEAHFELEYV